MTFPFKRVFESKTFAAHRPQGVTPCRKALPFIWFVILSSLLVAQPKVLHVVYKPKTDKFERYVVAAGLKVITIKKRRDIYYYVRNFNYSPKVEQKPMNKKFEPGMNATVHYI